MWDLDCEESWAPRNWCLWTVVLEKTLESPLDCKEIQPVHSEGDHPWNLFGRNDAKVETLVFCPPHAKSWLTGKDSDAGRDWGQEEKGMTEDEMAGWMTRWMWVWVNSGSWWWTGRPGVLRFMGSRRVGHNWATELNWTEYDCYVDQENGTDELICKAEIETQTWRTNLWKAREEGKWDWIGRLGLTYIRCVCAWSIASVVSDSLWPYGLKPTIVLCPWESPGKNTEVDCHAFLQEIFPTQGLKLHLLMSPASAGGFFTAIATWEAPYIHYCVLIL